MRNNILKTHSKPYIARTGKYTQGYRISPLDRAIIANLMKHGVTLHICTNRYQAGYYASRVRAIIYHSDRDLVQMCKMTTRDHIMVAWTLDKFNEPKATPAMIDKAYTLGSFTKNDKLPPEICASIKHRLNKIVNEGEEPVFEGEDAIRDYIMNNIESEEKE